MSSNWAAAFISLEVLLFFLCYNHKLQGILEGFHVIDQHKVALKTKQEEVLFPVWDKPGRERKAVSVRAD